MRTCASTIIYLLTCRMFQYITCHIVSTGRQVSPVRVFTAFMHRIPVIVLATTTAVSFYHSQCPHYHPKNTNPLNRKQQAVILPTLPSIYPTFKNPPTTTTTYKPPNSTYVYILVFLCVDHVCYICSLKEKKYTKRK